MRNILFVIFAFCSAAGWSESRVLLSCTEAFSGQLPTVKILEEGHNLTATLENKASSGKVTQETYAVKDISGLNDIRYVDNDTSGSVFLLRGGKAGNPLTLSVQAMTSDFQTVQATLHCVKH